MIEFIQKILLVITGEFFRVVFTKWVNTKWSGEATGHHTPPVSLENNTINPKKLSLEQFNERVFLSQWTYYCFTILWFYCVLALSYIIIFEYSKHTHHIIQDNFLSNIGLEFVRDTVTLISIIFVVFLYQIVHSISKIFDLIVMGLEKKGVNFSKSKVQQLRMSTTMFASTVLSVFLAYSTY